MGFVGVQPGNKIEFNGLKFAFAPMEHSTSVLAIKVSSRKHSYCYSGDGQFKDQAVAMYHGSDLVIQETYLYDEKKIGHACIVDAIKMAEENGIKSLALTHMQRDFRKNNLLAL